MPPHLQHSPRRRANRVSGPASTIAVTSLPVRHSVRRSPTSGREKTVRNSCVLAPPLVQPCRRNAIEIAIVLTEALVADPPQAGGLAAGGAGLFGNELGIVDAVDDAVIPNGNRRVGILDDRRGTRTGAERERNRQCRQPAFSSGAECHRFSRKR